jgi:hypothetical protein
VTVRYGFKKDARRGDEKKPPLRQIFKKIVNKNAIKFKILDPYTFDQQNQF